MRCSVPSLYFILYTLYFILYFIQAVRAVLRAFGANLAANFRAASGRFVAPVAPGETLQTRMWVDGTRSSGDSGAHRVQFVTCAKASGNAVIGNGYVDLGELQPASTARARL